MEFKVNYKIDDKCIKQAGLNDFSVYFPLQKINIIPDNPKTFHFDWKVTEYMINAEKQLLNFLGINMEEEQSP